MLCVCIFCIIFFFFAFSHRERMEEVFYVNEDNSVSPFYRVSDKT